MASIKVGDVVIVKGTRKGRTLREIKRDRGAMTVEALTPDGRVACVWHDDAKSWDVMRELVAPGALRGPGSCGGPRGLLLPGGLRRSRPGRLDESQRTLAKAAGMAKPSDAAAILGLRSHDSTPGPRQTKRAGTKMRDWREAPEVREAGEERLGRVLSVPYLGGVSYTLLTDRGGSDLATTSTWSAGWRSRAGSSRSAVSPPCRSR